ALSHCRKRRALGKNWSTMLSHGVAGAGSLEGVPVPAVLLRRAPVRIRCSGSGVPGLPGGWAGPQHPRRPWHATCQPFLLPSSFFPIARSRPMLRALLVPLDGSAFGEHALPIALGLARRTGAHLQLAHVHQLVPPATIAGVAVMDNLELRLKKEEMAY